MATSFPLNPSLNQIYQGYYWDGNFWKKTGQDAGFGYLEEATLQSTYLSQSSASTNYLTKASASTTYATNANPTFTGEVRVGTNATLSFEGATGDSNRTILVAEDPTLPQLIVVPNASGTIALTSSPTFTGTANFASASVVGTLDIAEVRETVVTNSFSTNVMTANYNDGAIHYATVAPTGNFTISLTNVPTTTSKSITMSFLITQGSTGYIPTTLNLNGSSQTIRWVGGSAPTPTSSAGKIDIFNFTLILAASNVVIASANLNI